LEDDRMGQALLQLIEPQDPREALRKTGGRDELNLAEFPITLLADRIPAGCKTLEFEDAVFDQQANAMVTRRLTITGSDRYGLPTAVDDEILVALIQLTKLGNDFTERKLEFTRYELLELLKWSHRGDSYERIEESLNRWMGVTLYYDKAWWDKDSKSWIDAKFHVLESVFLVDQATRRRRSAKGKKEAMLSWFSWNEVVFRSFQAENLKRLDVDTYFSLKSSISKRMYRFLDKRFYHRTRWEFDLKEFAHEHIGLSRNYTPPKIKEKLQPALEELMAIGFLEPLSREERFAKAGRGNWKIIVIKKTATPEQEPRQSELTELERELAIRGVSQSRASELVAAHPVERIRVKMEVFDWMLASKDKRLAKNPAGFLVKSIEDDYTAPKGFETETERASRQAAEREKARQKAEANRQKSAEANRQKEIRDRVLAYWDALSPEAKRDLDALAQANAAPSILSQYAATPKSMASMFFKVSIRHPHIRRVLGFPPQEVTDS
jgi:hypothetical protein